MSKTDAKRKGAVQYFVRATWDADASVFYVDETNVPGLSTEAENPAVLAQKLAQIIPDLLEANGCEFPESVSLTFHQEEEIKVAVAA